MSQDNGSTERRKKRGKDRRAPAPAPVPSMPEPAAVDGRPPGQRLYDMPFSSVAPRLIKPELGLHNLVARSGSNAAYTIDVTLLDAPDHRLIRSGVLLAHRVLDGRGEWFLTAPEWQPLLPKDRIELMGHADIPDELASLIRPLRRRATLGPVAALNCDRREFALRDGSGATVALLRDDKVTVRRGGLTTARYREVMVTPVGPGLTEEQRAFLDRAFGGAGANRVPRFPRLVSRLGAPATGPSDIPETQPYDGDASFRRFVATVVGNRLHAIVRGDLAIRGGDHDGAPRIETEAAALRGELAGLAGALDPEWADDLAEDLDWLVRSASDAPARLAAGGPAAQLRSERYLSVLERLVAAARTPRLQVDGSEPAAVVLDRLLAAGTARLREVADGLAADAGDEAWLRVQLRFDALRRLTEVADPVLPDRAGAVAAALRKPGRRLDAASDRRARDRPDLTGLDAAQAFDAGRRFERGVERGRLARQDFVERWAKAVRRLP